MKNDAQRVARAPVHAAHAVPQIHAIVATRTLHRPIARRKNNRLALLGNHHLRLGLRSGLLLDEDELSAIPIAALAAEQKNHLQRKADLAVKRSEEHTSELQSHSDLVCRLLLEKKKK